MTAPFYVAIPARCAATRLPDKPLRIIAGRPMLQWVYAHACESGARAVAIAAGDERVLRCAQEFGATVYATDAAHPNGTARLAELVDYTGWADDAIVVNLQGDEPLLPPALVAALAADLHAHPRAFAATVSAPLDRQEWRRLQAVKVWSDPRGYARGFARDPYGLRRAACRRHLGLYAYRVRDLRAYARLEPTPREQKESLEQWRILEHGLRLHVLETAAAPPPGVDTEMDLKRVRRLVRRQA